ncbi:MAG: precorrin-6y C5,15-methyltransferase (decarboxylating) subunit CbiE, partial [Firmicutes bacterium]|nr:precorrin-6y C5,15-methyltransferase (decarboxylating) subunit CbiE [Bacillota bacterium]
MRKLYLVGIGPGGRDYVTPAAEKIISGCDVLIGGKRNLEAFRDLDKEKLAIGGNLEDVCDYINKNIESRSIAVIATGDPGLYSIMGFLGERLKGIEMEVVPGISSLQYLCSRLKISWDDIAITSLHGREQPDFIEMVRKNEKVAVFTGGESGPESVCRKLLREGMANVTVTVGENLSYPDERIVSGTPEEISRMSFGSLSVMIVRHGEESLGKAGCWEYAGSGIPDSLFVQGSLPMTKEEIRAVSVSKLRLKEDYVVYDIGAGTGSVAVECALRCGRGKVFAVE